MFTLKANIVSSNFVTTCYPTTTTAFLNVAVNGFMYRNFDTYKTSLLACSTRTRAMWYMPMHIAELTACIIFSFFENICLSY
jgi:hypothetical protein